MSKNLDSLFDAIVAGNSPEAVNYCIIHALELGASDIHIEPSELNVRLRFRIDGELNLVTEYPLGLHMNIVARIKILSGLKTDESRLPQDGVYSTTLDSGGEVDLRVNTLPTVFGEKVCMRIQDKTKEIPSIEDMGIRCSGLANLKKAIEKPTGILLVTGPTGSGKTTTLYSSLNILNKPGVNIMTVEDPVEYKMQGLNQCQIRTDIGFDFSTGLRAALRQDPNIIMIGEIRDKATVEIALRAAMTGHLVLSTLHTNSAVSSINRLLDMGVKPFLIAGTVNAIQAQRLVRRTCSNCSVKYTADENVKKEVLKELEGLPDTEGLDVSKIKDELILTKGEGCDVCNNTGYKGRLGVYEVLAMNRELEEMVVAGASEIQLLDKAKEQGFVPMIQDGLIKAIGGLTTIEEVFEAINAD